MTSSNDSQPDHNSLFERACAAATNAYSPYSGVRVGAAVESESGQVFEGCNVENASYGLTVCAERVALFAMVAAGQTRATRIAISVTGPDGADATSEPCGACLQCMAEFGDDRLLVITGPDRVQPLRAHLPRPFRLSPAE